MRRPPGGHLSSNATKEAGSLHHKERRASARRKKRSVLVVQRPLEEAFGASTYKNASRH
ncbi:MAG TPA: hypothetical protein PKK16_06590 [Bacteroidales bacterium]|nr:hypothetical protein [Bacteroidales bacterium]HNT48438.1 hypothetical protein [Bacteroidales bacterium]HPA43595.1 hypothetical protein [Bacteroidales bacterium]HQQ81322.1 hypothetical protein [Bacteroidales bacterium]